MSDEDMTCLFCGRGGVRAVVIDEVTDPGCDIANVLIYATSCLYCGARGPMALSEDEAVAALNLRAERTCNVESSHVEWERGAYSYLEVELSCGHAFTWDDGAPPDYCPFCGARIIREETDDAD